MNRRSIHSRKYYTKISIYCKQRNKTAVYTKSSRRKSWLD